MGKEEKTRPKRIELKAPEREAFLKRVRDRALVEEDYALIEGMVGTLQCLSQALKESGASIKRLLKYLFGAPTEAAKKLFPDKDPEKEGQKPERPEGTKPKGHGRNGASNYKGGSHVEVPHPSLKPGDPCPECPKGKVYELALPSIVVHVVGGAPLQATVYELMRLRCNLCGKIFTAPLPEEAAGEKYDESAAAMIAILKYRCGLPFHRLEKLQEGLGMPVPASTQWQILDASSKSAQPAYDALVKEAAQGELVHNDDTTARILEYLNQEAPEGRTGIFTTGIISVKEGRKIAIFITGRQHAGENLGDLLKKRASGLAPPLQMCDALRRNVPKEFQTILGNCLAHARRQFVDVVPMFPGECEQVIDLLGKVYHNDALAREEGLDPMARLAFHQRESGPIMDRLRAWCEEQLDQKRVEPNSGLGKAIKYMLRHWEKLTRFLHVPKAPLDNNICERALKLAVRHRKNALFYKTQHGAHVGDLFMSLIHTCELAGENALDYLTQILRNASKVAEAPERWLPWNYREA